ncbi:MFS transporter [Agrobacterium fabrum]|uniref:MFS transporter n=1 Tax=Agrobacterium fabrum TaxID=1176649 RepID=UPI00215704EE|nr:MFS transporter [Agrobacterium fabrum]MCR6727737.1 MFS transporter [Agrobacterium fabrum]
MTAISSGTRNSGAILAVILISYLMIILDVSIVITGLPRIRDELGFTPSALGWIQSAYTLSFGGFLLLGARAGDILGRRRTFQIGLAVFTIASVAIGLAQTASWMIAARSVQGLGAAILAPSTLALLSASFPEGPERMRATAWYGSTAGIGASIGLVLGGILADTLSWRFGFFINLPIGIAMAVLGSRYIEETERQKGHFDLLGAIGSTLGFGCLTYGVLNSGEQGWSDPVTSATVITGLVVIALFVWHESRSPQPIMPLRLFSSRERVGAYIARFLYLAAMVGFFFFTTQLMQGVEGFSPLLAGVGFLPMTLVNFAVAMFVPHLSQKLGNKRLLLLGVFVTFVGMYWLSRATGDASYLFDVAIPMILIGAGQGFCFAPLTSTAIKGTEKRDAGAASGLVNVAHQMGMSFGLAFLIAISTFATSGEAGPAAIAHGFSVAIRTGSLLILAAFVAAWLLLPNDMKSLRLDPAKA